MQTGNLETALNVTRRLGLPVMPQQRIAVLDVSKNLRSALNHSVLTKQSQSVLPEDLMASATLLTLIAE